MSPIDMRKLLALVKKNAAKAAKATEDANPRDRRFDKTLPRHSVDQEERERFFKEMQKREF
ncbi:MAG: hypothetical protein AAB409_08515 [Gemmatimonadota bacterium]